MGIVNRMDFVGHCTEHVFELASAMCGHCGHLYCDGCLLKPFPRRPPLCKSCAMAAAGIRSAAARTPVRSAKEIKANHRATRHGERHPGAADHGPQPLPHGPMTTSPGVVPPELAEIPVPARTRRRWRST